jgi:hypothetical protein
VQPAVILKQAGFTPRDRAVVDHTAFDLTCGVFMLRVWLTNDQSRASLDIALTPDLDGQPCRWRHWSYAVRPEADRVLFEVLEFLRIVS